MTFIKPERQGNLDALRHEPYAGIGFWGPGGEIRLNESYRVIIQRKLEARKHSERPLSRKQPRLWEPGEQAFRVKIVALLEERPVETGHGHPAQSVLDDALRVNPERAQFWIYYLLRELLDRPTTAADLIQCLGRIHYHRIDKAATPVVNLGLHQDDVSIREATIAAVEDWAAPALLQSLAAHRDPVDWLHAYAAQVVEDCR